MNYEYEMKKFLAQKEFKRKATLKYVQKAGSLGLQKYYKRMRKTDTEGIENLSDTATFNDLIKALVDGKEIYDEFNIIASDIREVLFEKLTKIMKIDYDCVYYTWLGNH